MQLHVHGLGVDTSVHARAHTHTRTPWPVLVGHTLKGETTEVCVAAVKLCCWNRFFSTVVVVEGGAGGSTVVGGRWGGRLIKQINQPTLLAPRPDSDQLWSWFDGECPRCPASFRPRLSRRVRGGAAEPCPPVRSGRPDWPRRWTAWSGLDRP